MEAFSNYRGQRARAFGRRLRYLCPPLVSHRFQRLQSAQSLGSHGKRMFARIGLEEHRPQRVDVGSLVDRFRRGGVGCEERLEMFRRHVCQRASHIAG